MYKIKSISMNNINFEKWDKEFRNQNLFAFNNNKNALLWLKVRAISKRIPMSKFLEQNNIQLNATKITDQNKELFSRLETDIDNALNLLDAYLRESGWVWRSAVLGC